MSIDHDRRIALLPVRWKRYSFVANTDIDLQNFGADACTIYFFSRIN